MSELSTTPRFSLNHGPLPEEGLRAPVPRRSPLVLDRQMITEELAVRLLYLWTRDADLDPRSLFVRSYLADILEAVTHPEFGVAVDPDARYVDPEREAACRQLLSYFHPATLLPAPSPKLRVVK